MCRGHVGIIAQAERARYVDEKAETGDNKETHGRRPKNVYVLVLYTALCSQQGYRCLNE